VGEPTPHPIVQVLAERGVSKQGLAKATGYQRGYLSMVVLGHLPATPKLRRKCAEALGMPEGELFHAAGSAPDRFPGDATLKQVASQ